MALLDSTMRSLASTLLGSMGGAATIIKTKSVFNPRADTTSNVSTTSYPVKVSPPVPFSYQAIDGTNVQKGDLKCFAAAVDFPEIPRTVTDKSWTMTFGGQKFLIVGCEPVYSGDLPAGYYLQCRR